MKIFAAILLLATLAQSRPRHILVPYDDEIEQVRFVPCYLGTGCRVARSAFPQDAQPAFAIPDGIRAAEELIAAGSGPSRRRRSPQYEADQSVAGSTTYAKGHPKGRVGPVYTFVKTDPKANYNWGVRHVGGVQYGK